MEQLLLAVDLMHRSEVLHRDIKPDNILVLNKKHLKVCFADLGLSCKTTDTRRIKQKCGTPGYVDPDVLRGKRFSPKSDVFSLGSLLFNLITIKMLFQGNTPLEILHSNKYVNAQTYIDETCSCVSEQCRDLLKMMISPR